MEFKLSTSNWIQLLSPQFLAVLFLLTSTDNIEENSNIFSGLINLIYQFVSLLILPEGNITYFRCLAVANFYIILLMIASILPHEYKVKTGRSFESKHARFDEYKTVKAGPSYVPDNYIYFVILLIHILIIVLYFKTGSHIISNNNENTTTVIDSSYTAPEEAPATTYQESSVDTSSNQIDTTSDDYNSFNENQNSTVNDGEVNYFLGKWVDENSFITFSAGGKCTLELKSNGYTKDYYWKYENQILYMGSDINDLVQHAIYFKDSDSFSYKADGENTIYHAIRF